jgi:hypothetical protein
MSTQDKVKLNHLVFLQIFHYVLKKKKIQNHNTYFKN